MKSINLFLLFIIYSFIGWLLEIIYAYKKNKHFINRGFLIGPYCPIYGISCIIMILLLYRYLNDPLVLFVMATLLCTLIEYVTSYILEKIFNARWWNYSNRRYNLNGRVCLEMMIPFGLLSCIIMYIVNPFFSRVLDMINYKIKIIIFIIILLFFIIDLILSLKIIYKLNLKAKKIRIDNQEEITKKVKEYICNYSWFGNRLMKSFPHLKFFKGKTK